MKKTKVLHTIKRNGVYYLNLRWGKWLEREELQW